MSRSSLACEQLCAALLPDYPEAYVDYLPDISLDEVDARRIVITPEGQTGDNLSRTQSDINLRIGMVLIQRCAGQDPKTQVEALLDVAEGLYNKIQRLVLPIGIVTGFKSFPLYDLDVLRNDRVFFAPLDAVIKCRE